jgi:hypothetical protein
VDGRPLLKVAIALLVLVAVGVAAVLSWFTGDVARYADAYVFLEAGEAIAPADGGDDERVRLANAMVESEPPRGLPVGKRLHPRGTLAHLRYEQLAADGRVVSTTEVRALVPALPYFGADAPGAILGRVECPRGCSEALARNDAVQIARGGAPGLAHEWVLRMPVGQAFDLGKTSFTLQDLEDARPISLPHAHYRATLVEACPARARVGKVTELEFHPHAMLPIPKGFHVSRWVQLEGCTTLAKRAPPRAPPVAAVAATSLEAPPYAYRPPELRIVVPRRGAVGRPELIVDETQWLRFKLEKLHVAFRRICRYEAKGNRWVALPMPQAGLEVSGPGLMNRTRVAYRFDEGPGLYFAEWSEASPEDPAAAIQFALVIAGGSGVHCRESDLPQPAPGEIALCVPRHGPALPGTVPDPASACPPPA